MAAPEQAFPALWPPQTLDDKLYALSLATTPLFAPGERDALVREVYPARPEPVTPYRFWQVVNRLIDEAEVYAVRPAECARLRRLRSRPRGRVVLL